MHAVQVQLIELQGPARPARVIGHTLEPELVRHHVQRPGELAPVEIEGEDAVETGRGEEQPPLVNRDFVAMPEIRVAPRRDRLEIRRVGKELVASGDVDDLAIECDAAQAPVPTAALPVDGSRVPVEGLAHVPPFQIDQEHAAVTLALVRATYDRRRDELHGRVRAGHTSACLSAGATVSPLLAERQTDRAWAL